jgi:hypothetical protein
VAKAQFKPTDIDVSQPVAEVLKSKPDALVVWVFADQPQRVAKSAKDAGFAGTLFFDAAAAGDLFPQGTSGGAVNNATLIFPQTMAIDDVIATTPAKAARKQWFRDYTARYGMYYGPASFAADAVHLLVNAIDQVDITRPGGGAQRAGDHPDGRPERPDSDHPGQPLRADAAGPGRPGGHLRPLAAQGLSGAGPANGPAPRRSTAVGSDRFIGHSSSQTPGGDGWRGTRSGTGGLPEVLQLNEPAAVTRRATVGEHVHLACLTVDDPADRLVHQSRLTAVERVEAVVRRSERDHNVRVEVPVPRLLFTRLEHDLPHAHLVVLEDDLLADRAQGHFRAARSGDDRTC